MPRTVNIHEAKTHLSRLVDEAARGEGFIIAKAGKPMVRVVPLEADVPASVPRALGGLAGRARVPADIKTGFATDIERLFGLAPAAPTDA